MKKSSLLCVVVCLWVVGMGQQAWAGLLADSVAEFSTTQGQDNWEYGFFIKGPENGPAYTVAAFEQFNNFVGTDATTGRWEASNAQVGAQNNEFLSLNAEGGHPTGLGPERRTASSGLYAGTSVMLPGRWISRLI